MLLDPSVVVSNPVPLILAPVPWRALSVLGDATAIYPAPLRYMAVHRQRSSFERHSLVWTATGQTESRCGVLSARLPPEWFRFSTSEARFTAGHFLCACDPDATAYSNGVVSLVWAIDKDKRQHR
jgi:hypothetical protein